MNTTLKYMILILLIMPLSTLASTKENFLKDLEKWEIPKNLGYPRLYFNSEGLKKLHKQYLSADPRILSFLSECDSLIIHPVPDYSDYNLSRYKARSESEKLSFAYAITQKISYANYAREIIKQMVQWNNWVYEEHKPRRVDLGVAGVAYILALCYDWLYPVLPDSERIAIEEVIINQALIPFNEVYAAKSEGWTQAEHNWRSVICGEMGVVTLALLEKAPKVKENLRFAIDGVIDVLNHGGVDGGWNEGVSYWGYGIGQAMMFVEVLHQVSDGAVNLYELPFLKVTADFGLYTRTPGGECFNFSDCNIGPPKPWLMALLASHYQNPTWQWSAHKDLGSSIPEILFYNPDLPESKPINLDMGKHFKGIQVATMRSSWDDDAVFIGFKSGKTFVNHSHLDLNSFILHAYGNPLLIDQPNWPYAHYLGFFDSKNQRWDFEGNHTIAHNTLLVDGQGQGYGEAFEGTILNFSTSNELQFMVGEANSAYGNLLKRFQRYMALVDGKFVVIVDNLAANEIRKMEWLMHYAGNVKEDKAGVFKINNGDARLDLQFIRPSREDNRVVSFENRETSYRATRKITRQTNRFISLRPLHRQQAFRFIALAIPYGDNEQPIYSAEVLSETERYLKLHVILNNITYKITFDFESTDVIFSK